MAQVPVKEEKIGTNEGKSIDHEPYFSDAAVIHLGLHSKHNYFQLPCCSCELTLCTEEMDQRKITVIKLRFREMVLQENGAEWSEK